MPVSERISAGSYAAVCGWEAMRARSCAVSCECRASSTKAGGVGEASLSVMRSPTCPWANQPNPIRAATAAIRRSFKPIPCQHKTAFQPAGGMEHGFRGTRQRGGKSQPEGVAVLQVRHDLHGRFRVMGQIVLDLDPPRGIELLVHIGEEIGFGDGIRHRILR